MLIFNATNSEVHKNFVKAVENTFDALSREEIVTEAGLVGSEKQALSEAVIAAEMFIHGVATCAAPGSDYKPVFYHFSRGFQGTIHIADSGSQRIRFGPRKTLQRDIDEEACAYTVNPPQSALIVVADRANRMAR